jgi:hypothetical protein
MLVVDMIYYYIAVDAIFRSDVIRDERRGDKEPLTLEAG